MERWRARGGGSVISSAGTASPGQHSLLQTLHSLGAPLAKMTADVQQMPQIHVLEKLRELPLVECAYNTSTGVYNKVKSSNSLITWTLQSAEGAFFTAVGAVAPVLQQPIHVVDDTLCKGIDVLQQKVPIVKDQPAQIVEKAKTIVTATIQPKVDQITTITNKSWEKANEVLATTKYGNVALTGLDTASATADQYIDYYLPAEEGEENIHPHPSADCEDKVMHTVHTVGTLSTKVGRRVYRTLSARRTSNARPEPAATPQDTKPKAD